MLIEEKYKFLFPLFLDLFSLKDFGLNNKYYLGLSAFTIEMVCQIMSKFFENFFLKIY